MPWSNKCIISETLRTSQTRKNNRVTATETTRATFHINNAKLYTPVVTLPINKNIKVLENIEQGFKIAISWNKYRSEITTQPKIII